VYERIRPGFKLSHGSSQGLITKSIMRTRQDGRDYVRKRMLAFRDDENGDIECRDIEILEQGQFRVCTLVSKRTLCLLPDSRRDYSILHAQLESRSNIWILSYFLRLIGVCKECGRNAVIVSLCTCMATSTCPHRRGSPPERHPNLSQCLSILQVTSYLRYRHGFILSACCL
jgi:hypothetical protein